MTNALRCICLTVLLLLSACATTMNTELVFKNCVNTWETIDYASDATLRAFGDLYKQDKITEEEAEQLIHTAEVLRQELLISRDFMLNYLWEKEKHADDFDGSSRVIQLAGILRSNILSYYQLKDLASGLYTKATGGTLYAIDIPLVELPEEYKEVK